MGTPRSNTITELMTNYLKVRETAPPFRVLEKCQDLCLRDRSGNSLVRTCNSIDFQPGARIAAFSPEPEYEESTCYLTREQATPEGIGTLMIVPNSVHFNEICLTCELSITVLLINFLSALILLTSGLLL